MDSEAAHVLVFAPIGRDGPASAVLLQRVGLTAAICTDLDDLMERLQRGAETVFIAEEGLFGRDIQALRSWVDNQPPWSDLPFVVLTSHQDQPSVAAWRQRLIQALRNVSLLERPVQALTLTSTILAAVRARRRQEEVRTLLDARERAAQELEALVIARTCELEERNQELLREMAERARAEENLRQAQRIEALGQLTGGVAHDFNNLLMVISGGLEMIDRQTDQTRRHRIMDGMRQATQRGAALTRQLLAFSRRQALQPTAVDIVGKIGGMRDLLDRTLRADVHVALEFPEELWPVEVDPGEFELVLLNLAVNARDAMPDGGTIRITAANLPACRDGDSGGGDAVRLQVSDSGTGMSPEVQARVFEPFFTTKEIGKGSGLGLAQVYGFAVQSGGTVRIDSAVGQGTTVTLVLPRSTSTPELSGDATEKGEIARQKPRTAGRVLFVEDDDEVAALVTEMLEELGYEVTRTASAPGALGALADGRQIDVVFSDIMMPGGMNGIELAREIGARRRNLPVLLTSGYPGQAKLSAEAIGIGVLEKPYRLDDLAAALAAVLQHSGRSSRRH